MSNVCKNKDIILLNYYEGAYGPTIRIDVRSVEALNKIREIFLRLAESKENAINFTDIDYVKAIGLKHLILKRISQHEKLAKWLEHVSGDISGIGFCWAMSSDNWEVAVGLIDGLLESNRPGHQYLTQEGIDDAIVELAFME